MNEGMKRGAKLNQGGAPAPMGSAPFKGTMGSGSSARTTKGVMGSGKESSAVPAKGVQGKG
jgi:hypothetical protein